MKKTFFSAFVLAVSVIGFSVSAQTPDQSASQLQSQTECTNQGCSKAGGKSGKCVNGKAKKQFAKRDSSMCGERVHPSPFADLNLTADQQQKIDAINKEFHKSNKDREKAKTHEEMRERTKESRQQYLNKIKEVLTPEQYTQFLENNYSKAPRVKKDARRAARPGFKAPRGERAVSPAKASASQAVSQAVQNTL